MAPGHAWQKSSFSGEGANCVNVAFSDGPIIRIRESDEPGIELATTPSRLAALLAAVKTGRLA